MSSLNERAVVRPQRLHHPEKEALDLATIMRTLGDPVRLEIVRILSDGRPRLCGDIAQLIGLPMSTGSYHLRLLREAGVTRSHPEGTKRLISLRRDDIDERFPGLTEVIAA